MLSVGEEYVDVKRGRFGRHTKLHNGIIIMLADIENCYSSNGVYAKDVSIQMS